MVSVKQKVKQKRRIGITGEEAGTNLDMVAREESLRWGHLCKTSCRR